MCRDVKLSCQEKDDILNKDPNLFKKQFPDLTFLIRNTNKMPLKGDKDEPGDEDEPLTPQGYIDYTFDTTCQDP